MLYFCCTDLVQYAHFNLFSVPSTSTISNQGYNFPLLTGFFNHGLSVMFLDVNSLLSTATYTVSNKLITRMIRHIFARAYLVGFFLRSTYIQRNNRGRLSTSLRHFYYAPLQKLKVQTLYKYMHVVNILVRRLICYEIQSAQRLNNFDCFAPPSSRRLLTFE